jgi:hypothetical protein
VKVIGTNLQDVKIIEMDVFTIIVDFYGKLTKEKFSEAGIILILQDNHSIS